MLQKCLPCSTFSTKKTSAPIKPHKVPSRCWETVAVDLFGPMPSSKHVVVVQDIGSRFPAAKLVTSTKASKVLPALGSIYDAYGNPKKQICDNGPPFNSQSMQDFASTRGINIQHIPPLHPSANPAETFMRPLGKTMKIANFRNTSEESALQQLLENYRDTPHPATGISPASMMFRDGQEGIFPRNIATDSAIQKAREKDAKLKETRECDVNKSKFRQPTVIEEGDKVLMRNHQKRIKFDPDFLHEPFKVEEIRDDGRFIILERESDGSIFRRHPDDIKVFHGEFPSKLVNQGGSKFQKWVLDYDPLEEEDDDETPVVRDTNTGDAMRIDGDRSIGDDANIGGDTLNTNANGADNLRRSTRIKRPNPRYFNADFKN